MKHETREGWLTAAVDELREHFRSLKLVVPAKVRAACGWPFTRGFAAECWSAKCSGDGSIEIFVSPMLACPVDYTVPHQGILSLLVHELVHAVVGISQGHQTKFKRVAQIIGLEGKLSATYAGLDLTVVLEEIAEDLGPYPHTPLVPLAKPKKKSTCRMLKVQCPGCGYIARVSRMWLDEAGPPLCPVCKLAFEEKTGK